VPINSRQKGKAGELEWKNFLVSQGFAARRGQQYSGTADSPDVVCEELDWLHAEVKRVEHLQLGKAMNKARLECAGTDKTPYVAHRANRQPWMVTMLAADWAQIVKALTPKHPEGNAYD